jgi:hypothetical protein
MLNKNFYSFVRPKINQRDYESNLNDSGAFSGNLDVFKNIISYIGRGDKKVLDLASGDGTFGKLASDMQSGWKVDGVDLYIPEKVKNNKNYASYENVFEQNIFDFDFSGYDYVIANHFFEHLYIDQIINLMGRLNGAKLIISVPLPHLTVAYNKFYLKAAEEVEYVEYYDYLVGGMHKTVFDSQLNKYLKLKKINNFKWCQILEKSSDLSDKDRYLAQLYVTKSQEKLSYIIINNIFFVLLSPLRLIKKLIS